MKNVEVKMSTWCGGERSIVGSDLGRSAQVHGGQLLNVLFVKALYNCCNDQSQSEVVMLSTRFRLPGLAALLVTVMVACNDDSTMPDPVAQLLTAAFTTGVADTGEFEICKHGTAAQFHVTINGNAPTAVSLAAGECQVLATSNELGVGPHTVTVSEDAAVGMVLDSIVAESVSVRFTTPVRSAPITGTNTITETFDGDQGWMIDFFNSPVSGGCTATLGYWKNHTNVWPLGFDPNATFYTSGKSWITVLKTPPVGDAYYILAHQFIAATLNAADGASVPANVQTALNSAAGYFADPAGSSLTRTQLIALATLLDSYNNGNQGVPHCP
jgi:hypothetical protein